MKILQFGKHKLPFTDIHDINLEYIYHAKEMYVDLAINGGVQMSLNLPDSLAFMEQFIQKIRDVKNVPSTPVETTA